MEENIGKAFSEVSDILKHSDSAIQSKIPNEFKKMIEQYKDLNYKVEVDYSKSINEQKLLKETREILALIYRDYLCSKEEREQLIENNIKELDKLKEQYDISRIFEERNNKNIEKQEQKLAMIIPKKKLHQRILEMLKIKFSRNDKGERYDKEI